IRFTLKEGVNVDWALKEIASLIPEEARLVKAQQLQEFISDVSSQAVAFLGIWSLAVYAVVAASSYTVASRLAAESNREISTLICLGAERRRIFALLVSYTAIAALFGSALGVALGVAGSQAASTALAWLTPSVRVEPFLEPLQALQVCALTVASAVLGCAHPAAAAAKSCAPRGA
ncbi:MAG: FtsX-like permease family protein, partial [Desulfurococcaceae archaeon]